MLHTAFRHAVILAYLGFALSGIAYTLWRIEPPVFRTFAIFSYQTMSPYQGYRTVHRDVYIEGLNAAGEWEQIPTERYLPFRRGERFIRSGFASFAARGDGALNAAYSRFALRIRAAEKQRGNAYSAVRLFVDEWPLSSDGIDALRTGTGLVRTPVGSV